jgi:thiosulfate dehydrogenase [quinone] large subunit
MAANNEPAWKGGLAFLPVRFLIGFYFLRYGYQKCVGGFVSGKDLTDSIQSWLPKSYPEFYRGFLQSTVLPHASTFAWLVAVGEFLVGICLLLGLLTRLAAVMGMVMNVSYIMAMGLAPLAFHFNQLFVAGELVIVIGGAGRFLGLDYFLAKRWPHGPFW